MDDNTFVLATVANVSGSTAALLIDGASAATQKRYKILTTGATLSAGDRVLAASVSGTLVILGKIPT